MKETLIIRADASAQIGAGHVMRCLALAQAWQDAGGKCIFVMAMDAGSLFEKLEQEHMDVIRINTVPGSREDSAITAGIADKANSQWLILDGYHFTAEYQKQIKNAKLKLLVIDDNCEQEHYYADYILNQNIHANESLYPVEKRESYTQLLLGLRYCLLRREFLKYQEHCREITSVPRKILVTLGNADPDNITCRVLEALKTILTSEYQLKVVAGGNNRHCSEIEAMASTFGSNVEILYNAQNMPELMLWADLAISAAGSTVWELCMMGLPFILIVAAENQRNSANALDNSGIAINIYEPDAGTLANMLKDMDSVSASQMRRQSAEMKNLVKDRRVEAICRHMMFHEVYLRAVANDDCKILWQWANDAETRANSFSQQPIPWEDHVKWFNAKHNNPDCLIYIAERLDKVSLGYVRAEFGNDNAIISVLVAPEFRAHGLGTIMIRQGTEKIMNSGRVEKIIAYIKDSNIPSLRAFKTAGYDDHGETFYKNENCRLLIFQRKA